MYGPLLRIEGFSHVHLACLGARGEAKETAEVPCSHTNMDGRWVVVDGGCNVHTEKRALARPVALPRLGWLGWLDWPSGSIGRSHRTCSLGQSNGPGRGVAVARARELWSSPGPLLLLQSAERPMAGRADRHGGMASMAQECLVAAGWAKCSGSTRGGQSQSGRHAKPTPRQRVDAM